jgi:AcrR family transcriptional regulator
MLRSREKIIHATVSLVHELGIEHAATARISQEAGVATGTLFHHYPNKKLLFEAVHQHILDDYVWHLMGFFDYPEDQVGKQLKKAIKASVDYWVRNPAYFSFMNQMMHSGFYSMVMARERDAYIEKRMGQAFQLAISQGLITRYDHPILLKLLFRIIFQVADLILQAETENEKMKCRQQGIEFIWTAIESQTN